MQAFGLLVIGLVILSGCIEQNETSQIPSDLSPYLPPETNTYVDAQNGFQLFYTSDWSPYSGGVIESVKFKLIKGVPGGKKFSSININSKEADYEMDGLDYLNDLNSSEYDQEIRTIIETKITDLKKGFDKVEIISTGKTTLQYNNTRIPAIEIRLKYDSNDFTFGNTTLSQIFTQTKTRTYAITYGTPEGIDHEDPTYFDEYKLVRQSFKIID